MNEASNLTNNINMIESLVSYEHATKHRIKLPKKYQPA